MQLPQIIHNSLPDVDSETLLELQQVVTGLRASSNDEEDEGVWEVTLAAIEVELWSRGYGPDQVE